MMHSCSVTSEPNPETFIHLYIYIYIYTYKSFYTKQLTNYIFILNKIHYIYIFYLIYIICKLLCVCIYIYIYIYIIRQSELFTYIHHSDGLLCIIIKQEKY